jgi:hypothetical protein
MRYPARSGSVLAVQVIVAAQAVLEHNMMMAVMALTQFIQMLLFSFPGIAQTIPGEGDCLNKKFHIELMNYDSIIQAVSLKESVSGILPSLRDIIVTYRSMRCLVARYGLDSQSIEAIRN